MWIATPPPPEAFSPERLFRLLLEPVPSIPITFRFADVEHPPLEVRAVSAASLAACGDAALQGGERGASRYWAAVTALAVHAADGRVFHDVADVIELPDTEIEALSRAVVAALSVCGPNYSHSDWPSWHSVLVRGAEHFANAGTAAALGGCFDVGGGIAKPRAIERPDRFFGLPMHALLDGHWMVYRAARALFEREHK